MGVMRFDHPDILKFVTAKTQPDTLRTFNISVAVSDPFVDLVRRKADYPLLNPRTGQEAGRLNARQVFDAIVDSAWRTGDPGLVFLDAINRQNPIASIASNAKAKGARIGRPRVTVDAVQVARLRDSGASMRPPFRGSHLGARRLRAWFMNGTELPWESI